MRYLPNLIPKHARVLPDYFKGHPYAVAKKPPQALTVLSYTGGVFFFLLAFASLLHPLLTLLFGSLGFVLLPQGHRFVEKIFRFRLTPKIKTGFIACLLAAAIPATIHYNIIDARAAELARAQAQKEAAAKAIAEEQARKKAQLQADSFNYYLNQSEAFASAGKQDEALKALGQARLLAASPTETEQVGRQHTAINSLQTQELLKRGKYKEAIPRLDEVIAGEPANDEARCQRALCYSKTGRMPEAVGELKLAMEHGSAEAEKLHEKINPLRKRISYYLTRCCDGTASPSNAKGSGACSHHGGVCDWNEPVYEEYRQYQ